MEKADKKQINFWTIAVIVAILISLFLIAQNNRYESVQVPDCNYLKSGNQPCVKILDKWVGKYKTS